MYRLIVRRRYRATWAAMNRHDAEAVIDQLAPKFAITFVGDTPLGGTRTTVTATRAWFARLFRLFPDARFDMRAVAVDGPPWNTRIAGSFTISATACGQPYENVFTQFARLRWGRITGYEIIEDTQLMATTCAAMVAAGVEEAAAAPITD